jgi:hypothetical protein
MNAMRVCCANLDRVASRGIPRIRMEIIQTGKDENPWSCVIRHRQKKSLGALLEKIIVEI